VNNGPAFSRTRGFSSLPSSGSSAIFKGQKMNHRAKSYLANDRSSVPELAARFGVFNANGNASASRLSITGGGIGAKRGTLPAQFSI
jgi:hypothetical protein